MYDFKEIVYILFLDFIKLMMIFFIGYIISETILFNVSLGKNIADILSIPYDQTLTVMSIGFVNEFTIILTLFEGIIILNMLNYLSRFKALKRICLCLYNFLNFDKF